MIPSNFLVLEAFPLTSSGKVDRKALPTPSGARPDLAAGYVASRTPTEELLTGIWTDVLKVDRVGIHDSFFELGGHSLLATQLVSRIRDAVQVEVSLQSLFESPTVAGVAAEIEEARHAGAVSIAPPIERVSLEGDVPLSFAQERLWFLDQLEPASAVYNIPAAVRLTGELDNSLLELSFREVMRRHETLRTTFQSTDGRPSAVIDDDPAPVLHLMDLSGLLPAEKEAEARRIAIDEASQPFDLATGPLLRFVLLRLDEREHILLITLHHIISDGWSITVFVNEIGALYEAFVSGQSSPLPELPIRYSDFAHWQRDWLQGDVLEQQLAYWKEQLADNLVLDIPSDHPRPAAPSHRGARERFVLSRDLSDGLQALSRSEGVTLFMTLLGGFQVLLSRYAGQDDVSVGTAIANRTHGETEGLIGFFVNTLVMRTDLSGNPTLREVLRRVRDVALGAYAQQDLPFEKVVEALQPKRDLSHAPLFQVMFVLENIPVDAIELPGLSVGSVESEGSGTAKFDLTLSIAESADGLHGELEYNLDLFDGATIRRMVSHLEGLFEELVADADRRVGEVEFVGGEERERLLGDWNETGVEYSSELCAHELFERRARESGEAAAVRFEGEELSYGEVDRRANQLARYLGGLGVGRGDLVGLSVDRGVEMVVGVLGALKAGAAYVPIDPSYPAERVAYMLEDSGVGVVLTQSQLVGELPLGEARAVCLDGDWEEIGREEESKPEVEVSSGDVAYVIYTSGSTGRPKGTVLSHGGLVNLSEAQRAEFGIREGSRVLQFAPLSFDASVWEMFMALGNGGTLVVVRQEVLSSVGELRGVLKEEGVTTVTMPPSVLGVLENGALPELRTVVAAGEACSLELVRRWGVDGREFFNAYGPTETTVCASMYRCDGSEDQAPPVGRPLANMRLYVLDGNQRLVPEGVPGELCVGGVGLAQGYLRRPEMTAEKFIPDAFGGGAGGRLYRTGDLVRYRSGGHLEFLGRIDHQVKLRGFRIELGGTRRYAWRPTAGRLLDSRPGDRAARQRLARGDAGEGGGVHGAFLLRIPRGVPTDPQREGRPKCIAASRWPRCGAG
jgi:amino acid adenylation domain-containing protein